MSGAKTPQILISLDVVFDFIFVADTLLRFYLPYVDENTGQIVLDPDLIKAKYRASWTFWINSIACIPIVKLPLTPFLTLDQQNALLTYFNVLRMIRVLHLPGQFYRLKKLRERKDPVNEAVFRMYFILFFMLLFMFECGSLYFGLSTLTVVNDICPPSAAFEQTILGQEMWVASDTVITDVMDTRVCGVDPELACNDCPQTLFFTRAVYYLMQTIFTIGYGDSVVPSKSSIEMALACAFMIFGVFAYAMTIANMTSVLANLDVVNMVFRHEMDTISHWMTMRSVPNQLKERVVLYFSHLSRSQHGMLDDQILGELPPYLSMKLAELNIDLLAKIPFFKRDLRGQDFISLVAAKLKRRVYTPGAFILYQGEMQREMVIFKSGKAEMHLNGVKDPVGSLLPGDYIGDYQLLFGCPNQVGVQASEFTDVAVLTFDAFREVVDQKSMTDMSCFTFRESQDDGALETIETNKQSMVRLSAMASSILNGKNKNNKLMNMMDDIQVVSKEFSIKPTAHIHVYWDIVSIVAILYYTVDFPIRIAHYSRANSLETSYDASFIIGYFFDLLLIGDMILRSTVYAFTTHMDGKPVIVSDRAEIRRRYIHSGKFKLDLFASIPFDIISHIAGRFHLLFRLPKLIRVIQIPGGLSRLQEDLDVCMNVKTTETQKSILLMLIFSFLLIVWGSSGWNALRQDESGILSVYWTITTLSTVGYGDVTPSNFSETCYALFVGATGAVFTAAVVANVTSFFHDAELSECNYEHKLKCLKRFMDRHKVSHDCTQTIVDYFSYVDEEQNGLDEGILLKQSFPDTLSKNLLVHITHSMVSSTRLTFFSENITHCFNSIGGGM
jgi:CRP-like cAMP-binding protein